MSSSTSIDIHYLAYANNKWSRFGGTDHPEADATPPSDGKIHPDNPLQYSNLLKICDGSIITLTGLDVDQGSECSVDLNNHATANLQGSFGNSTNGIGNQIFSVKGNSQLTVSGILKGSGNRLSTDIIIDNWSDQSFNGSKVDLTNLKHETGRKLKVVFRYGASTIVGDCEKLVWESIKLTAYWWLKWIVRKVMGIKLGVKGPSWL